MTVGMVDLVAVDEHEGAQRSRITGGGNLG